MKLPIPDPIAHEHSERLRQKLLAEIDACGPLSFERYMQMALYSPGLGYYSAGARKFGEAGDFVTAPELSSMFSQSLANQCRQILSSIPGGVILELGAGSGVMARDILLELKKQNALPDRYFILEVSADLRDRQHALLSACDPDIAGRVEWLSAWPEKIKGVVLANEVLDAMPVHRFLWDGELLECFVTEKAGELDWCFKQPTPALEKAFGALELQLPSPYLSEVNTLLPSWMASLRDALEEGVVLFIDYGFPRSEFYHSDRNQGTLMCHYRHRSHDNPLIFPGIQDITAHVDFTAVASAAKGFDVLGYTNQALFLLGCGIEQFMQQDAEVVDHYNLAQQVKRLTLPSEMGELFKVIALGKHYDHDLIGFQINNQIERLGNF